MEKKKKKEKNVARMKNILNFAAWHNGQANEYWIIKTHNSEEIYNDFFSGWAGDYIGFEPEFVQEDGHECKYKCRFGGLDSYSC